MQERAEEYEQLSLSLPGMNYDADKVQKTRSTEAPFVKWLMKLGDLNNEIEVEKKKLDEILIEVTTAIESVEKENYRTVLTYRYVDDKNWLDIKDDLDVSEATVHRWHTAALYEIKIPKNESQ